MLPMKKDIAIRQTEQIELEEEENLLVRLQSIIVSGPIKQ